MKMADLPESVGFIGLGLMGYPMVQNLAQKLPESSKIYVYDVAEEAMNNISEEYSSKVEKCTSAKEVAEQSDTIISMLPEGKHVQDVYLNEDKGIICASSLEKKLLIDSSTIDAAASQQVRDAVLSKHPSTAGFYDSPVSGGVLGAQKGTMTFMLGASLSDAQLPRLKAILSLMGGNVFPCGGPTLGLTAKLCNNYCSGLIAIATSEAMNIGIKSGMDPRILAQVFSASLAQSCINDKWNPCPGICPDAPASKGYKGGFKVGLMRKDFNLAVEAAGRVGAELALGEKGLQVYTQAMEDESCRGLDSRVVYRFLGGDEKWKERFRDEKSEGES